MAARLWQTFVGRMPEGLRGRVEIRVAPGGSSYAVISDGSRFGALENHGDAPRLAGQIGRDLPRSKRPTRRTSGSRPRDGELTAPGLEPVCNGGDLRNRIDVVKKGRIRGPKKIGSRWAERVGSG
jgi:hypothetical protein